MASSEQPERGGSEQGQEEDEDEDDSQDAAEYQIPRSTPVVAPRVGTELILAPLLSSTPLPHLTPAYHVSLLHLFMERRYIITKA